VSYILETTRVYVSVSVSYPYPCQCSGFIIHKSRAASMATVDIIPSTMMQEGGPHCEGFSTRSLNISRNSSATLDLLVGDTVTLKSLGERSWGKPSATKVNLKSGKSVYWRRRLWMCCALTKVILWPLWLRSFVKQNMGLMWPSAGKGNATRWGGAVEPCCSMFGDWWEEGKWIQLLSMDAFDPITHRSINKVCFGND